MIEHLTDEITRQQEQYMQNSEAIKQQKRAEKEKIRAIITGAGNRSNKGSDKGSPTAKSEQQQVRRRKRQYSFTNADKLLGLEPNLATENSE